MHNKGYLKYSRAIEQGSENSQARRTQLSYTRSPNAGAQLQLRLSYYLPYGIHRKAVTN